jgi:hypothetical protein
MTKLAPPKKWLQDARKRVTLLLATADDRYVQWKHGTHRAARAEIMARVAAMPGGADLLKSAKKHGVKIYVVRPGRIDDVQGRFSRGPAGAVIRVANRGDIARMTTTLWHELRHMQQHIDRGDMKSAAGKLHNAQDEHVIGMMIEADAFTAQTLMALREAKNGNPEYIDAMMAKGGGARGCIGKFLKNSPPESFPDERHFARALFAEIMENGLPRYSAKYFERHNKIFNKAASVDQFRKVVAEAGRASPFIPTEKLSGIYFAANDSVPAVNDLARLFLEKQPEDARTTLALIEDTVTKAAALKEEEFQQARDTILERTQSLTDSFNKKAGYKKPKPTFFKRLRSALGI